MSQQAIAHRYAKPLFELALHQNILDEVNADMALLKETCDANKQLLAVLRNPVIRGYKKTAILKAIFGGKSHRLTSLLFELLGKKDREDMLYEISKEFNIFYNEHKNIQKVRVDTVVALPENLKNDLILILSQKIGKNIQLTEKIDSSLIGGFVIHIGNSQIDNSIKNSIQRLKLNFLQSI